MLPRAVLEAELLFMSDAYPPPSARALAGFNSNPLPSPPVPAAWAEGFSKAVERTASP